MAIRKLIRAFFDYRIDALESRLSHYQEERDKTIQRLKDATKYDSTLQLLQKYGAPRERRQAAEAAEEHDRRDGSRERPPPRMQAAVMPLRTGLAPPPTANIPRPTTPQSRPVSAGDSAATADGGAGAGAFYRHAQVPQLYVDESLGSSGGAAPDLSITMNPLLAPAAAPPPGPRQFEPAAPHWYDRILDLLMGEDETSAKNRIVLICWKCRLVNGQAPPGTKRLGDIGHWRCKECRAMNGEADEGKKLVSEMLKRKADRVGGSAAGSDPGGGGGGSGDDGDGDGEDLKDLAEDLAQVAKKEDVGATEADMDSKDDGLKKRKGRHNNR